MSVLIEHYNHRWLDANSMQGFNIKNSLLKENYNFNFYFLEDSERSNFWNTLIFLLLYSIFFK